MTNFEEKPPLDAVPYYDKNGQVEGTLDLTNAHWQSAPDANPDEGDTELAFVTHTNGVTYTVLRNSGSPDGPFLIYTPAEWTAFVEGVRLGEFEGPWVDSTEA